MGISNTKESQDELNAKRNSFYSSLSNKTTEELLDIVKSKNEYTEMVVQIVIDILKERDVEVNDEEEQCIPKNKSHTTNSNSIFKSVLLVMIALFTLSSALCNAFTFIDTSEFFNKSPIYNNCYEASGDQLSGMIFFFLDDNTYRASYASSESVLYGTYEVHNSAITLRTSNDTFEAVILDQGNSIMFNDNTLSKITDPDELQKYIRKFNIKQ